MKYVSLRIELLLDRISNDKDEGVKELMEVKEQMLNDIELLKKQSGNNCSTSTLKNLSVIPDILDGATSFKQSVMEIAALLAGVGMMVIIAQYE